MKLRLPSISYIVARSWPDSVIGRENRLPWHLSTDLRRFKTITLDHVIIMGRKTFESVGKALPNRVNLVLSRYPYPDVRNSFWNVSGTALVWVENRETAIFYADVFSLTKNQKEFFVIGGEHMYNIFEDLFNKIYMTEVFTGKNTIGDAFFDYNFDRRKWKTLYEEEVSRGPKDDHPSRFSILERKIKTVRYVDLPDYYTDAKVRQQWIATQAELFKTEDLDYVKNKVQQYQYSLEFEDS